MNYPEALLVIIYTWRVGEDRKPTHSRPFPCCRLDNGKRDTHRLGQHPYDHFAHEDGGQIAVCDIIGVDGAVDRPVTCETQSYCLNSDGAALCKDKFFFAEGFAISTEFLI